jgi:DNA (cytosine-5)-methyltransferase 1
VDLNGMMMIPTIHKTGPWHLSELAEIEKNGFKVFSCFHGGGGSTMGYKLSGFEVLGGVEIDKQMMDVYRKNHNPKFSFLMGIQEFNKIENNKLPAELFDLDILDGSPPCSTFSLSGLREKSWGKEKKFREGQAVQVLDDLFFDFIETANKLKPKIVVAENVKGLLLGKAKGYVKKIAQTFDDVGYSVQLFLLNAAFMGVPQKRERVFFIAKRKDLNLSKLNLSFNEKVIDLKTVFQNVNEKNFKKIRSENLFKLWKKCAPGAKFSSVHEKKMYWNYAKVSLNEPAPTLCANSKNMFFHPIEPRTLSTLERCRIQSFPDDFDFLKSNSCYVCGMSVPPYMINRISKQIELQWLKKI